MTIYPGRYVPTNRGHTTRVVTTVTGTSVTYYPEGQEKVTYSLLPVDFGVWVYVAQARHDP